MTQGIQAASAFAAKAFKSACLAELEALKPGNVHIFADGHGMVVQDFLHSAEAAQVIAGPDLTVGQRILAAVEATRQAVSHNTNLGIILLCAPLIHAYLNGKAALREDLRDVLQNLTIVDAELAYRAIVIASPAGLGSGVNHDVAEPPRITLLHAMQEAAQRDRIALQYVNGFEDIFGMGMTRYRETLQKWDNPAWTTTAVYMGFLAALPDTHIGRKYGESVALGVQKRAKELDQKLLHLDNPKHCLRDLLKYDAELKAEGLNPGTSADFTVATLLAEALENTKTMRAP